MNEMLRSLGFDQVTNTKWANGSSMSVLVNPANLNLACLGNVNNAVEIDQLRDYMFHDIFATEKFICMVGKCIRVDEG